ncbi:hypothetical protein ANSO36C_01260 [Nostoc cf. commune SO-36]|uniref:Uncharacterized protein n=1 Tax=Nostoc cf. commune SO-36 TaxID=449208 RepID=A0ABN6PW32_NOSCO|nr:hypothetical protein ANSO36C_01260 [Nostoc cf. commune SO-36]
MATSNGVEVSLNFARVAEVVSVRNPKTRAMLRAIATITIKKFLRRFPNGDSGFSGELTGAVLIRKSLKFIKQFLL